MSLAWFLEASTPPTVLLFQISYKNKSPKGHLPGVPGFFNCIFSKDGILLFKKPNFSIQKIEPGKNKSVFPGRQATCGRAPSGPRRYLSSKDLYIEECYHGFGPQVKQIGIFRSQHCPLFRVDSTLFVFLKIENSRG